METTCMICGTEFEGGDCPDVDLHPVAARVDMILQDHIWWYLDKYPGNPGRDAWIAGVACALHTDTWRAPDDGDEAGSWEVYMNDLIQLIERRIGLSNELPYVREFQ